MLQKLKYIVLAGLIIFVQGNFNVISAQDGFDLPTALYNDSVKLDLKPFESAPISMGMFEQKSMLSTDFLPEKPFLPKFNYDVYKLPALPNYTAGMNFNFNQPSYNYQKFYPLFNYSALILNNNQLTLPGLGASNSISGTYLWQPDERLTLTFTGTGMRYVDFSGLKNNFFTGGSARFALTDRIGLNAFGTYSLYQNQNADYSTMMLSPFDHRTSYGGSIDFRITEHWGVEIGSITQFNPFSRKWETIPFASPKYYK